MQQKNNDKNKTLDEFPVLSSAKYSTRYQETDLDLINRDV